MGRMNARVLLADAGFWIAEGLPVRADAQNRNDAGTISFHLRCQRAAAVNKIFSRELGRGGGRMRYDITNSDSKFQQFALCKRRDQTIRESGFE